MLRILIADDHDLVRDTLATFLEKDGEAEVVMASDFGQAMETQKGEQEKGAKFDLILLDWSMPGMDGIESLGAAKAAAGETPVGVISGTASRETAEAALAAGAAGFVPKTLPAKSLRNAVRFMAEGEQFAPVRWMTEQEAPAPANPLAERLTERETQVLGGLCRGLANKEIAIELDLQEVTVKLHVKTICRKLDARNRTHAAMIARDEGLF